MNDNNLNGQDQNISPTTQPNDVQSNANDTSVISNQVNNEVSPAGTSAGLTTTDNGLSSNMSGLGGTSTEPSAGSNNQSITNNGQINSSIPGDEKKKNKTLLIVLAVIILAVCGVLGFIFIKNNFLNSPEKIFKSSIDKITSLINKGADNYNLNSKLYDISLNIDSNYDELKLFKNYTFGIKAGADTKNKALEANIYMLDSSKNEYSFASYIKNKKMFMKLSSYDKLIDLGVMENNEFKELFEAMENYNSDDFKYIINKSSSLLKDNLDKKNFSKEDTSIKVNSKDIKAVKNTYKADSKEIARLSKAISDGLYKDDKAMEIITKMFGISKDEFKNTTNEDVYSNDNLLFNIYMNGDKFAGFDIVENDGTSLSYYTDGENFDIDLSGFVINGVKNGKQTDVSISSGGYELAKLNVRKFDENNIDLDYNIAYSDDSYSNDQSGFTGSAVYKRTVSGRTYDSTLNLSVKNAGYYINFAFRTDGKEGAKIADINEAGAVALSDDELQEVVANFISSLQNTPVGNLIYGLDMSSIESGSESLAF